MVPPRLSIVIPVFDEVENIAPLLAELDQALPHFEPNAEVLVVDDGSSDGTAEALEAAAMQSATLRVLRLPASWRRKGNGQTTALRAGFAAARADIVASMDGDRQNDPADLAPLLARLQLDDVDLVQGDRTESRRDSFVRRASSWIAWMTRRLLLGDRTRDTGCTLRVMRHEVASALPLEYRGMHRFLPVLAQTFGYRVTTIPVQHRPRTAGTSKYGIRNRLVAPLLDCLAVRWMIRRVSIVDASERVRANAPLIEVKTSMPQHAERA